MDIIFGHYLVYSYDILLFHLRRMEYLLLIFLFADWALIATTILKSLLLSIFFCSWLVFILSWYPLNLFSNILIFPLRLLLRLSLILWIKLKLVIRLCSWRCKILDVKGNRSRWRTVTWWLDCKILLDFLEFFQDDLDWFFEDYSVQIESMTFSNERDTIHLSSFLLMFLKTKSIIL